MQTSGYNTLGASISTAEIDDGNVTTAKLADKAVTNAKNGGLRILASGTLAPTTAAAHDVASVTVAAADLAVKDTIRVIFNCSGRAANSLQPYVKITDTSGPTTATLQTLAASANDIYQEFIISNLQGAANGNTIWVEKRSDNSVFSCANASDNTLTANWATEACTIAAGVTKVGTGSNIINASIEVLKGD